MEIDRRSFLRWLGAAGIAATLPAALADLPKLQEAAAAEGVAVTLDEVNRLCMKHLIPGLVDLYFREDPLIKLLSRKVREEPVPFEPVEDPDEKFWGRGFDV